MNAIESQHTISVSRTIRVKTMITDAFRAEAQKEDGEELQKVESNIQELREIAQQRLASIHQSTELKDEDKQLASQHLQGQFDQDMMQLLNMKQEIMIRKETLEKTGNGTYITTGELRDTVNVNVGDSIYDKLRKAEILVTDGKITAILA